MIFKLILVACIIGAIIGFLFSKNPFTGAMNGAVNGGCMAAGCIVRVILGILVLGFIVVLLLWCFGLILL